MAGINYAAQYAQALAQMYPYVLNFGALYATPNNGRQDHLHPAHFHYWTCEFRPGYDCNGYTEL